MYSRLTTAALALAAALYGAHSFAQTTAPGPDWGHKNTDHPTRGSLKLEARDNMALVVFGRLGCPFAVVGQEVWNLDKQEKLSVTIPHNGDRDTVAALSDDGKLLVVGKGPERIRSHLRSRAPQDDAAAASDNADATVWNTQTGEKICEIPSNERDVDVEYLALAGDKFVIIGARPNGSRKPQLEVWDAQTGKLLRRFPCNYNAANGVSLSPDGHYAAVADAEDVNLYDLTNGKEVTSMPQLPNARVGVRVNMNPNSIHVDRAVMSFMNLECLAFSPDGNELAGVVGPFDRHFFSWNHDAELVDNFSLPFDEFTDSRGRQFLQWLPNRSSWIVNQHWLMDRKTQRFLWAFPVAFGEYPKTTVIDDKRLFVLRDGGSARGEVISIPWDAIHNAQNAMAKEPCLIKPGDKVSFELKLVNPRGNDAFARQVLTNALAKAFESGGIQIADNQPTVATLSIEEAADEPQDILRRLNPFGGQSEPTGRKASVAKGLLTLTIHARGSDAALYKLVFDSRGNDAFNGAITNDSLRQSMFIILASRLERTTLPYFLSKTDPSLMLPLGLAPANNVPADFLKPIHDPNPLVEMPNPAEPALPRRTHPAVPVPADPPSPVQGM